MGVLAGGDGGDAFMCVRFVLYTPWLQYCHGIMNALWTVSKWMYTLDQVPAGLSFKC